MKTRTRECERGCKTNKKTERERERETIGTQGMIDLQFGLKPVVSR